MQVFKSFFKIAKKRLPSLSMYFCIYMFIILMFSFTSDKSIESSFQAAALRISVQDSDQSKASEALIEYLATMHAIDTTVQTRTELANLLYYRYMDYVLIIPEGFEEKLLANETKELFTNLVIPGSNTGTFVSEQINQFTQTIVLNLAGGNTLEEAIKATMQCIDTLPDVHLATSAKHTGAKNSTVFAFFQYQPYIFILILFVGMAPILVTHNAKDMKARTLCSAMTASNRTLQLALACCTFALMTWAAFQLLGIAVFRGDFFNTNVFLAMLNSFVILIFITVLTLLVGLFSPGDNAVNIIANVVGLGMSFLCGVFVPQYLLGENVLKVARFLPAYWYIQNNNMLSGTGSTVFDSKIYMQNLGIQLLFAVACFILTLGFAKSKKGSRI